MNENEKTQLPSDTTGSGAETARLPEPPEAATRAADRRPGSSERPGNGRRWLMIGAAVVALLAVGGGAYAIGANAGDADDRPAATAQRGPDDAADPDDDLGDDDLGDGGPGVADRPGDVADERNEGPAASDASGGAGTGTGLPASDAGALREAAEAAIAKADAKGATSIDVERGGYEVEVQLADGSQPDVFVATDGTVTVGSDRRDDDDRPDPLLDLGELAGIAKAAVAASAHAGGADGAVEAISTTDDPGSAYEVSLRLPDGRDASVDLAPDLAAVATDIDDD